MKELIISFAMLYWLEVVAVVVVFLIGLVLYKRGNEELLRKLILAFVVEAEKKLGSGTGELKYAMVVERLYDAMPMVLRFLFSKKQVDQMIEDAVEYLKRYLANGKDLRGYDEEARAS